MRLFLLLLVAVAAHVSADPIHDAASAGDTLAIMAAYEQDHDSVNAEDDNGETPLFAAVRAGEATAVDLLLRLGAAPNVVSKDGETPCTVAGLKEHVSIQASLSAAIQKAGKGKAVKRGAFTLYPSRFPDSTFLCGVRVGDTLANVKARLGGRYKVSRWLPGTQFEYKYISYADPASKAVLELSFTDPDVKLSSEVICMWLTTEGYEGTPRADVPFAALGTARGITLGSTKAQVEAAYAAERDKEHLVKYYVHPGCNSAWPLYFEFHYYKGRVKRIWAGFSP